MLYEDFAMTSLWKTIAGNPLSLLVLALPLAVIAQLAGWSQVLVFTFSAIAVIPLADFIGEGTEALAERTGPRLGGLLNATLGNAAELIITIFAIREGLLELVKASITGSILGNLLFVMGFAMIIGGARHGVQRFSAISLALKPARGSSFSVWASPS
jgi:Ca2+:H+ antiporter